MRGYASLFNLYQLIGKFDIRGFTHCIEHMLHLFTPNFLPDLFPTASITYQLVYFTNIDLQGRIKMVDTFCILNTAITGL